jgi:hypothetical protein
MREFVLSSSDPDIKRFAQKTLFAKDFRFFGGEKRTIFCSKSQLWRDVCIDTGLDLPWRTFWMWTRNFQQAKTRSDLCPICKRGLYLTNAERALKRKGKPLSAANAEALRAYRLHVVGNEKQRSALKQSIATLQRGKLIVITDFKQDWSLPLTLSQEQQDFFGPRQVAHLVFVIIDRKSVV